MANPKIGWSEEGMAEGKAIRRAKAPDELLNNSRRKHPPRRGRYDQSARRCILRKAAAFEAQGTRWGKELAEAYRRKLGAS